MEKVNPDLVVRDEQANANTVRCEAVKAMLLNEFLKGASQGSGTGSDGKLESTTAKQSEMIANQIEALTSVVQKGAIKLRAVNLHRS